MALRTTLVHATDDDDDRLCYVMVYVVLGLNALQLLNAAAAGSGPNPSSIPNSYGLSSACCFCSCILLFGWHCL